MQTKAPKAALVRSVTTSGRLPKIDIMGFSPDSVWVEAHPTIHNIQEILSSGLSPLARESLVGRRSVTSFDPVKLSFTGLRKVLPVVLSTSCVGKTPGNLFNQKDELIKTKSKSKQSWLNKEISRGRFCYCAEYNNKIYVFRTDSQRYAVAKLLQFTGFKIFPKVNRKTGKSNDLRKSLFKLTKMLNIFVWRCSVFFKGTKCLFRILSRILFYLGDNRLGKVASTLRKCKSRNLGEWCQLRDVSIVQIQEEQSSSEFQYSMGSHSELSSDSYSDYTD